MTKQRYDIPTFTKIYRINLIDMKYSMVVFTKVWVKVSKFSLMLKLNR